MRKVEGTYRKDVSFLPPNLTHFNQLIHRSSQRFSRWGRYTLAWCHFEVWHIKAGSDRGSGWAPPHKIIEFMLYSNAVSCIMRVIAWRKARKLTGATTVGTGKDWSPNFLAVVFKEQEISQQVVTRMHDLASEFANIFRGDIPGPSQREITRKTKNNFSAVVTPLCKLSNLLAIPSLGSI